MNLTFTEKVAFDLRSLYSRHGYSRYRMSKFEEYDLYARNKDFLISDRVITFTDNGGKLLALKPDVTLSIVKNSTDDITAQQKLYYNENVYRTDRNTGAFREIGQVGLECLGDIDDVCVCEILSLAAQSLLSISKNAVLTVSHLGVLSAALDGAGIPAGEKAAAMEYIRQKNTHELATLCRRCGIADDRIDALRQAVSTVGSPETAIPKVCCLLDGFTDTAALTRLLGVTDALAEQHKAIFRFDLSAVDDLRYYNGIVLKGFVKGIPDSVLSGGQYDRLMEKMHRKSRAMGFAVYMDALEMLEAPAAYDVDTVLLYSETDPLPAVRAKAEALIQEGKTVLIQRQMPVNIRCKEVLNM